MIQTSLPLASKIHTLKKYCTRTHITIILSVLSVRQSVRSTNKFNFLFKSISMLSIHLFFVFFSIHSLHSDMYIPGSVWSVKLSNRVQMVWIATTVVRAVVNNKQIRISYYQILVYKALTLKNVNSSNENEYFYKGKNKSKMTESNRK